MNSCSQLFPACAQCVGTQRCTKVLADGEVVPITGEFKCPKPFVNSNGICERCPSKRYTLRGATCKLSKTPAYIAAVIFAALTIILVVVVIVYFIYRKTISRPKQYRSSNNNGMVESRGAAAASETQEGQNITQFYESKVVEDTNENEIETVKHDPCQTADAVVISQRQFTNELMINENIQSSESKLIETIVNPGPQLLALTPRKMQIDSIIQSLIE